jgi:hypothetical protein
MRSAAPSRTAKPVLYTGPAVPTTYDPTWQTYTNLTKAQIAAFQGMPQDLAKYALIRGWQAHNKPLTVNGSTVTMVSPQATFGTDPTTRTVDITIKGVVPSKLDAVQTAAASRAQSTHDAYAKLVAGVNATPPTITTRAQVDAAFAAI